MIRLSERARIGIGQLPAGAMSRFQQIVSEIDTRRTPRIGDKKLFSSNSWVARVDDNYRLIYHLDNSGIYIEDLLDRERYPS